MAEQSLSEKHILFKQIASATGQYTEQSKQEQTVLLDVPYQNLQKETFTLEKLTDPAYLPNQRELLLALNIISSGGKKDQLIDQALYNKIRETFGWNGGQFEYFSKEYLHALSTYIAEKNKTVFSIRRATFYNSRNRSR